MKFTTTTTSSLLLASMALSSPSLSVAAPTGMEVPRSPNPAGTPNILQFDSPLFDGSVGHTPSKKRAPAFRTGPGSPRRNTPSRMVKASKRQNAPDAGIVDALGNTNLDNTGLLGSLFRTLSSLPIVGGLLGGQSAEEAGARVQASSATVAPLSNVNRIADPLSGLPPQGAASHLFTEPPSGSSLAGLGLSGFPASVGGVAGGAITGLPLDSVSNSLTGLEDSLPLVKGTVGGISGAAGGITSPLGLGIVPPNHLDPSTPSGPLPRIVQLPNGGFLINVDGVWKEVSNNVLAAESASVPAVAGSQPSAGASVHPAHPDQPPAPITSPEHHAQTAPAALAFDDEKSSSVPGVSVHPPSPPLSQVPAQPSPSAPATTPTHPSVQASVASAAVSPPVSKLSAQPAAPTGNAAPPNTPTEPNPKIQAVEFQPELPATPGSLTDSADIDGLLGGLEPGLIHGMAAP